MNKKVLAKHKDELMKQVKIIQVEDNQNFNLFGKLTIILSIFVLPIIASLILFTVKEFYPKDKEVLKLLRTINLYLVKIIIPLIGFVLLMTFDYKKVLKSKLIYYYIWTIAFPMLNGDLRDLIAKLVDKNDMNTFNAVYSIVSSLLVGSIILFFVFYKSETLKQMWTCNYQTKFVITIIVIAIGSLMYFLLNLVFSSLQNLITTQVSDNQGSIGVKPDKTLSILRNFFLAVLLAPIIEEIFYRKVLADSLDNKWYAVILTTILFAFAHIQNTLDWRHFITYLPLGIVNGYIYYLFKNIYPCIGIHFVVNVAAFIWPFIS